MPAKLSSVPRKRPKQERSQATVEAILEATARVLVKEGFDRASTNRVAEEAGVSIGSLYQYFPSKEALVAALMERHLDEMSRLIGSAVARLLSAPVRVAVRECVEIMIRAHAIDPKLHRVLMEQLPRTGGLARFHDVEHQVVELARTYLDLHRDEIRPKNLELAAVIMVQTIEALTHGAVIYRPHLLEDGEITDEITELVVRYLVSD